MPIRVPDILNRIAAQKRAELQSVRAAHHELERQARLSIAHRRDFRSALASPPALIAEIKKASPSKGVLTHSFDPAAIASAYQAGGAAAVSVLTDQHFFQGSFDHLAAARSAVHLPVLRKDFTLDECHVLEAAAHGADAVLLIAALLTEAQLRHFREFAASFQMSALVEVHDYDELARALSSGAEIVGVNNRDLHTFEVSLATSLSLAAHLPKHVTGVSESGIYSHSDVELLSHAGFQAFLVGEHLMKASDRTAAVRALLAPENSSATPSSPGRRPAEHLS